MIISASRRTDIPAFYSKWFMDRIRAGYCHVPNPYNSKQVAEVSLLPEDVEAIVFWSKDPSPMLSFLPELDRWGYRYYFLYTLNDYPTELEPKVPPTQKRIDTFRRLVEHVGERRVIWRYDPIILSNRTDCIFHERKFQELLSELKHYTRRVIISVADFYRKTDRRLAALADRGFEFVKEPLQHPEFVELFSTMKSLADQAGIALVSCCEDLAVADIPAGACIDAELIASLWGLPQPKKDRNQRPQCGCAVSKDVGMNDTCLHGCPYCYATRSQKAAVANFTRHEPGSSVLIGPTRERKNDPWKQLPLL